MYEPTYKKYYANDVEFDTLEEAQKFLDSGEMSSDIQEAYRRGLFDDGGEIDGNEPLLVSNYILNRHPKKDDVFQGGKVNGYKIVKFKKLKKHYGIVYEILLLDTKANADGNFNKRIVGYTPQTKKISDFRQSFLTATKGKYYTIWSDSDIDEKFKKGGLLAPNGTNTTFDGNNPDIRFDGGGEVNLDDLFSDLDLDAIINDLEVKAEKKASKKKYPVKKDTDTGSKTFGKIVFGDEEPSYKKKVRYNDLQDIPLDETEKDTKEEAKIKEYLQGWVNSLYFHKEIANEKELFKKLSREYPKVFKPATEKGTLLYRGLKRLNVEMLEELAETL